jgi:hypothetical protein
MRDMVAVKSTALRTSRTSGGYASGKCREGVMRNDSQHCCSTGPQGDVCNYFDVPAGPAAVRMWRHMN